MIRLVHAAVSSNLKMFLTTSKNPVETESVEEAPKSFFDTCDA